MSGSRQISTSFYDVLCREVPENGSSLSVEGVVNLAGSEEWLQVSSVRLLELHFE